MHALPRAARWYVIAMWLIAASWIVATLIRTPLQLENVLLLALWLPALHPGGFLRD